MALADRLDQRPLGATQIRIVLLMQLLLMVEGLDLQLLGLLAPVILEEWGMARAAFGPAMAAALVGLALGAGIGGPLGDRFGRKRVLMVSALIFALGTAAAGLTDNVVEMTLVRFASGMGFGAATPVSLALVTEWLPRRIQPTAIAFMAVGTPFGGMVGSLALISLIPVLGWRGCFIACGALTLFLALLVYLFLPDSPAHLAARGRIGEALRLVRRHLDPMLSEADLAPAAVPAGRAPAGPEQSAFDRTFWRLNLGGWLLFFAAQFIAYSLISWATTMLTMAHFPIEQALQGAFAFNVCAVTATLIAGPLISCFGSRRVLLTASVLTLLSLLVLLAALTDADGAPSAAAYGIIILAIAGVGIFVSTCIAAGYAVITLGYPEAVRSTGIGVALMIGRMGGVLTGLFGGWLLSVAGDRSAPLIVTLIGLTGVIFAGALIVNRHIMARGRAA